MALPMVCSGIFARPVLVMRDMRTRFRSGPRHATVIDLTHSRSCKTGADTIRSPPPPGSGTLLHREPLRPIRQGGRCAPPCAGRSAGRCHLRRPVLKRAGAWRHRPAGGRAPLDVAAAPGPPPARVAIGGRGGGASRVPARNLHRSLSGNPDPARDGHADGRGGDPRHPGRSRHLRWPGLIARGDAGCDRRP